VRVVIDHLAGTRRGQRQEFPANERVRFGRHPECEVSFDAHRDIDASSRHAELRVVEAGWVLVDVGSSNGTYVQGRRITEAAVAAATPLDVEFGTGGPRIRLFVGDDAAIEELPPAPLEVRRPVWVIPAAVLAVIAVLIAVLALRC
jgi:pSer/pThr/pTyr-binding forkhead associated (FHA) protein